jgi:two-component system sensor histidine kinase KdpD
MRPTDVAETIAAAVSSIGPSGGDVVMDFDGDLPQVSSDPALLERTIANLVSNATRSSPAPRSVRVTGEQFGSDILIRVIDRGPGIPEELRAKVLAPFQRLGDGPSSDGVGLGLSIAQGFVDALGGVMTFDDTPGGGLTVSISIPIDSELGS